MGCPDAVYFYNEDGRGACFAFAGDKHLVLCCRAYLLVVGSANTGGGGGEGSSSGGAQLQVYDVGNHLVAHSTTVTAVAHVLCDAGAFTVLLRDGTAVCLRERDLAAKMEQLFRKKLYTAALALTLVRTHPLLGLGLTWALTLEHEE